MSQKEEPNIIASKMESNVEAVAAIPTETNTTFVDKLNDLLNKIRKRDEGTPDKDREKNIKPLEMLELLEDEITNLKDAFNKVQEDYKSSQDESSEKQEKLNLLETDIDKKNEEISKLKDEYKKVVENEKKLITQANELDEQLSSVVAQKQNVISQLEKQLSDEQTKYSNIRRQLFQSEEDYDKKLVASRNELKQKEEEANELRIQTERLSNQIEELNNTINENAENQTIENEVKIEKQLDYIEKLEDQLKNKQNALTSKNRELVELKSQLAESSSRQRGDGVDIDELESELENAQASIAQLQHEKKLRDETIEKHQTKIKTLIADGREKDEKLREAQKSIEKLREEKVGVDLQLEEVLESSHVLDESKNVLIELEKQLEVFKKENQDLCKEKKILEEKSNKFEADLAEKNQQINSMQGEQSGDVSFIPQSDLVKLLLNDLQKEADEVLDLVLNYPDLHETHSTDNIRELQNIWANEKDALLSVIKSLKDFIANTTTSQLNLTIPPRDQSHDQTTSNENNTHEKRKNLMNLVKTIFEKEQEALIAEIESINACHAKDLPKEASSIRRHVEESKQLLADLESKDRDLLIQEISALRHTVEIVDSKIDQLNHQLSAKEKQNEKNQETILKLYVDVEEYQNKRNDLQKTVQEERSKTIDLTSQLAESRSNVQLLKHELETLSREKAQSDASTKHQDTVMKLYAQIENEQKRFADLSNKFEKLINEKSNLVMRISEKDLKIESLITELDTERSKAIKEHGNKEIHDDVGEKNKETMLKLYEQIEDAQIKNKELKNRIEHLTNEKNALSAKLTESNNKLKENSIVTTPSTSEVLEERYEKNQESLLKLYQIVDSEQEKNKDLKKTIHDLESDNATYAQQLSEANEMIESLQDVIKKEGENDKNSDKESIYEEKINENQEQLLKLYKVVDNEKAKRKELQQLLEKEKSESSKLKKRLSVFVKENSFLKNQSQRESFESESEKKHKDKMNGDKERIRDLERKIIALEQDKSQLEDDLMKQNEKLQNMFAKETKLKQKTDEVITLLESERNKRIGLEEMLDNANSLLQKERMRVDELNQMILKENDHLKSREKKVEELMKQLEYESKVLRQRQSTHDDIEREIYAKKNEIETMEQQMREEKNKSVEERKKITSLLSSLDDVEQEKHKLARALQEAKLHAKTVKQQLEEKIYELNDIQEKKVSDEQRMKETIADLKEKLNNEKVASDISEDGKKLLNAGWTIAKVQRLYLKYFRAESFRKALAYQKRYLLLLLSEYQQNEDSVLAFIAKLKSPVVGERRRYNVAKRRFRVAANAIIAINRLKYLTRKYQRNLHKSSPEYIYKDKPSKSKDLPKPTLSVVTEERPVEKSRSLTRQSKPNTESSQQHRPALHKRRSSTDKRLRLHKRDSGGDSSLSNHVMFSPDNEAIKNIASPPDDEKDSRSESKVGRVTSGSHNETKISTTRKDTYSPPTRLNGSAATHVSLTVPANSAVTNRSPRSPPRSYPRPKQLPAVPKSDRSHMGKVNEPTKQDSSASLNNYISKLENLQERLKEQSKNVHKKRNPLL